MAEKEKCWMCQAEYKKDDWVDGGAHDFRVSGNTLYYHDETFGWEGIEVSFCPICGRRLTEAAEQDSNADPLINDGTSEFERQIITECREDGMSDKDIAKWLKEI